MPEQRTGERESTADPLQTRGSVRPVPFDRLLSVARLTPAQASLVAVRLLDAARMSGTVEGEDFAAARLGTVTLTPSGDVEVGLTHADEGTRVTELLEQLLQNARRLPAHPRHEQVLLLHRLEEATRDPLLEPGARARELEGALANTLGSGARQRICGQLAALVAAFAHVTPSVLGPTETLAAPRRMGPATTAAAAGPACGSGTGPGCGAVDGSARVGREQPDGGQVGKSQ